MWIAKFKNWHKTCLIRPLCVKYNVTDFVYLLNSWQEGNQLYYTELHILQGTELNKQKFIEDFGKDPSTIELEVNGNHIFTLNKINSSTDIYAPVFNQQLIYVKPVVQRTDGYEDWIIACWHKEPLMNIMKIKDFDMKLISIENKSLGELFLPQLHPKLSAKQKEALTLAIKENYYEYPRKTSLQSLAKLQRISVPTFQEHLSKAENKLIPI